jgi:FAD/FMN-containing dehydrogenase
MAGAAAATGALAGAGVSAASIRPAWLHAPSASGGPLAADWQVLRRLLSTHRLVRPGQHGYRRAKELFDPRFDWQRPQGVAYCASAADVAVCLGFASRYKLPVRARSGGHSYAGWSGVTGGLVVDVSRLDSFDAHRDSRTDSTADMRTDTGKGSGTVRVGTGLSLIDFYARLAARGLAVPGGSCPTVGIAGLTLGGGVGVVSRLYGLTSDNLEAVQIVTANGDVLTCDSRRHSDLLWACRGGGGGNFGVATSFTLRTHKLRHLVLFFLSWPWARAERVVDAWQRWAPHAPDALWSNMHLSAAPGGKPVLGVGGTFVGGVAGAEAHLNELYARVGSGPASAYVRRVPYLDAMLVEAGCSGLRVHECHAGPGGRLARVPYYAKSDFFSRPLSKAGIRALLNGVERMRGVRTAAGGVGGVAFDAFGGALNRVHPEATAFVHRNALFLAQYTTSWNYPGSHHGVARQQDWLRSCYAALHPHASGGAYQNYIDPDLRNWRQAYYGRNYARLTRVKATYDPHQLFDFPQAITPT